VQDDITAIRPAQAFGYFQDKLVAGFDSTAANIRYRVAGDAPGSWTTVALAGFLCASQGNAMQEVGPYLWIASGAAKIFKFDGANLTLAQTIAGCDAGVTGCTALCLYQGLLHYGWNASTTFNSRIGRHDPDSTAANEWVDTYLDVTAQQVGFKRLSSMLSYRQQIYIGGSQVGVLATAPDDVKGTIVVINAPGSTAAGFERKQMVRFP